MSVFPWKSSDTLKDKIWKNKNNKNSQDCNLNWPYIQEVIIVYILVLYIWLVDFSVTAL